MLNSHEPQLTGRPWGILSAEELFSNTPGFHPAEGYHIYCELRLVNAAEDSEDDAEILLTVDAIERFVRLGEAAARLRGFVLLELQGPILHFLKVGEANPINTEAVIEFVGDFTQSAYEDLRSRLGDKWYGFASTFDHGRSVMINHSSRLTSSTVSLGPSANAPAKVLGDRSRSPAGHVTLPTRLIAHRSTDLRRSWTSIDVRGRAPAAAFRQRLLSDAFGEIPREVRRFIEGIDESSGQSGTHASTPGLPFRVSGSFLRFDLDGFTKLVELAFMQGEEAVRRLAGEFKNIMEYADLIANQHHPIYMMPWAGDCAGFILPSNFGPAKPVPRWLDLCFDWFGENFNHNQNPIRAIDGATWAAGASEKPNNTLIVATIEVQNRLFTFSMGSNRVIAQSAQEASKGGELGISPDDYASLQNSLRKLFVKSTTSDHWIAAEPSRDQFKRISIATGLAATAAKSAAISAAALPAIRPYGKTNE